MHRTSTSLSICSNLSFFASIRWLWCCSQFCLLSHWDSFLQLLFLILIDLRQILYLILQQFDVFLQSNISHFIVILIQLELLSELFVFIRHILKSVLHMTLLKSHCLDFLKQRPFSVPHCETVCPDHSVSVCDLLSALEHQSVSVRLMP